MIRALALALALALPAAAQDTSQGGDEALAWELCIDDRIEAAAPELSRFLARSDAALIEETADNAARERADFGADFRRHYLSICTEASVIAPGLISVLRSVESYTGGAHGNLFLDPLTWDRRAKDFVLLDHFLTDDAAGGKALRAISAALKADLSTREGLWADSVAMATVPDPSALQSFTLAPSTVAGRVGGLIFHFAPYELGPYSMGPQTALVPQERFRAGLKPQYRALFDGAPLP